MSACINSHYFYVLLPVPSGTHCSTYVRVPNILHGTYGNSLLLPVENLIRSEEADIYFSWIFYGQTLVAFKDWKDINMDESRFSFQPPNASLLIHLLNHAVEGEYRLDFYIKFPNGSKVSEHKMVRITVDGKLLMIIPSLSTVHLLIHAII